MKNLYFLSIIIVALVAATPFSAAAQENGQAVSSNLEVMRITTNANGQEVAEQVEDIAPGDTLEYRLTYTNNRDGAISNLQPVLPIPQGIFYLDGSASPAINAANLTLEGGTFEALPIIREQTTGSGLLVEREVPARQYRRLQWTVPSLDAGASVTMTARTRVESGQ